MEEPRKRRSTKKADRDGGGGASGDGVEHPSSPRSSKDKNPQSSAERRYKEMLNTTSHIYKTVTAGDLNETLEKSSSSTQSTQPQATESVLTQQRRTSYTTDILPEDITAEIPLAKIISKDQSLMLNPGDNLVVSALEDSVKKMVIPAENSAVEDGLLQVTDGSLSDVEYQNAHVPEESSASCKKHSSVRLNSKPKSLISRPKLCDSCTVSMLSYIAVLRDMLDEVTNEITNQEEQTVQCAECVKERVIQKNQTRTLERDHVPVDTPKRPRDLPLSKHTQTAERVSTDQTTLIERFPAASDLHQYHWQKSVGHQEKNAMTQTDERTVSSRNYQDTYVHSPADTKRDILAAQIDGQKWTDVCKEQDIKTDTPVTQIDGTKWTDVYKEERSHDNRRLTDEDKEEGWTDITEYAEGRGRKWADVSQEGSRPDQRDGGSDGSIPWERRETSADFVLDHSETPSYLTDQDRSSFSDLFRESEASVSHSATSDQRPSGDERGRESKTTSVGEAFHSQTSPFLRDRGESDGILSALSNEEREVYDSARGRAGWERLTDSQDYRDTSFGPNSTNEAFVTMATTNSEAISCLVLGSSLSLCRTTRTRCVLVTDGVSRSLRGPLASVFQVVQSVRSLDTVGTTKVALLDQPDLGIFFRKLHVWRLVQFSKCVFLSPDTLVLQNSDELFCHEELSAVPDIGWPDCFNSGVFVFQPSMETFWKLVEFAESEGSYDGGDQGLLNAFFKTWSKDIHKKLSFIYNLMANVSYTYTPAFKQFGRNVKIVQFQGPFKPWHVKVYTRTGQIAPSTSVHPTYVQFVHVWLNIFRVRVLPLFSQDIQSFASSQKIISASELLKFHPSPVENDPDFLLTPPSVRIRPDPLGIPKPTIMRRHSIASPQELRKEQQQQFPREDKPSEVPPPRTAFDDKADGSSTLDDSSRSKDGGDNRVAEQNEPTPPSEEAQAATEEQQPPSDTQKPEPSETEVQGDEEDKSSRSSIPGSEIGDYQGMAAWEQGRMDYMGSACSENILKRLHFLMDSPSDSESPQ